MVDGIDNSESFLSGRILLDVPMVQDWKHVIDIITPLTAGALNDQMTEVQAEVNSLLATVPQASIASGKMIVPITFVADFKYALATVEYQFNGALPQYNNYIDVVDECDSVYGQYSITYQTVGSSKLVIY